MHAVYRKKSELVGASPGKRVVQLRKEKEKKKNYHQGEIRAWKERVWHGKGAEKGKTEEGGVEALVNRGQHCQRKQKTNPLNNN